MEARANRYMRYDGILSTIYDEARHFERRRAIYPTRDGNRIKRESQELAHNIHCF